MSGMARRVRGFTLMELTVVIGLLGVVGLGFAFLYVNSQRYMVQGMVFSAAQGEASFGLEHIKRQLLQAVEVAEPAVGATTTRLTFQVRRVTGGAEVECQYEVVVDRDGVLVLQYSEDGVVIHPQYKADGAMISPPVARNVIALTFTRLSQTRLAVDLTARQASAGGDVRRVRLRTEVGLRGVF